MHVRLCSDNRKIPVRLVRVMGAHLVDDGEGIGLAMRRKRAVDNLAQRGFVRFGPGLNPEGRRPRVETQCALLKRRRTKCGCESGKIRPVVRIVRVKPAHGRVLFEGTLNDVQRAVGGGPRGVRLGPDQVDECHKNTFQIGLVAVRPEWRRRTAISSVRRVAIPERAA